MNNFTEEELNSVKIFESRDSQSFKEEKSNKIKIISRLNFYLLAIIASPFLCFIIAILHSSIFNTVGSWKFFDTIFFAVPTTIIVLIIAMIVYEALREKYKSRELSFSKTDMQSEKEGVESTKSIAKKQIIPLVITAFSILFFYNSIDSRIGSLINLGMTLMSLFALFVSHRQKKYVNAILVIPIIILIFNIIIVTTGIISNGDVGRISGEKHLKY